MPQAGVSEERESLTGEAKEATPGGKGKGKGVEVELLPVPIMRAFNAKGIQMI